LVLETYNADFVLKIFGLHKLFFFKLKLIIDLFKCNSQREQILLVEEKNN